MWAREFWNDESGVTDVATYLFFVTLVCLGTICGWVTIRDHVIQQLGDVSVALQNIDQTFSVNYTLGTLVKSASFIDNDAGNGVPGSAPAGINLSVAGAAEH